MSLIHGLLARQPVLITTIITAGVSLAVAYGAPIPPDAKAPLIALLVALATAFVHQTVAAPATVAEVARQTAAQLTTTTVGGAGKVAEAAANVANGVVQTVGGLVGALAPEIKGD